MRDRLIGEEIEVLIFDLGGVLLNLSFENTFQAFSSLSKMSIEEVREFANAELFKIYERGQLSDEQFRDLLRTSLGVQASNLELDSAWNAMLLDVPEKRLATIAKLKTQYKVYLLSNTNSIHERYFSRYVVERTGRSLEDYFHRIYYSHKLGIRKPEVEIYAHVLNESNIDGEKVLFFDDLHSNLEGARQAGITTFHVTNADELFERLDTNA
jgi:glucose-1-phosphatase